MEYPNYDSPINLITNQIMTDFANKTDDIIYKSVLNVGVDIDKEKLLKALSADSQRYREAYDRGYETATSKLYSTSEVAKIIADIIGDDCACNVNGNDEWLPYLCEYRESDCPNPPRYKCWEQFLVHKKFENIEEE